MISPETYIGYDENGNVVCSCTAVNATDYINPEEIKAAINKVSQVAEEQMKNVSSALMNITPDTEEAIIVQGTKMTGVIEDLCTSLGTIASSLTEAISGMYELAVTKHNEIQEMANTEARNAVATQSGVVRVG